jgi:hypothetical protein
MSLCARRQMSPGKPIRYLKSNQKLPTTRRKQRQFDSGTTVMRIELILTLMVTLLTACEPPPPFSLHTESKSPDGKWIADAVTTQDSGAGQPSFHTTVYLKSLTEPKVHAAVLTFADEIAKEKGRVQIAFFWSDTSVQILMSRLPIFETQVTRYAGFDISVAQGIFDKQTPPSAKQLADAFNSSDLKSARRLLPDLHCNPQTPEQVAVVRRAWHELGGASSTEVTQDHYVQAVMADCLVEGQSQNAAPDPDIESAVALLRSAVRSDAIVEALTGAEGLIHYADPRDNQSIVDIAHREPKVSTFLTVALSYSCSPNAGKTLQMMRDQAPDPATKDKIDANIKRAEPERHEKCNANP